MNNKILLSEDGFHTISSSKYGVTYHSMYGALNESITVFLSAGLQYQILNGRTEVSVFEMGLGTGLNALLTMMESRRSHISVDYTAIELYPLTIEEASQLNYVSELKDPSLTRAFDLIHTCSTGNFVGIIPGFRFRKYHGDLLTLPVEGNYDVIYYDAFAPAAQEDLWTSEVMEKMYSCLNPGGILVTYCAKGSFKRALKAAGFKVQALPGPPGKREMTRAIK